VTGAVLDAGALVAFARSDRRLVAIVARSLEHTDPLVVPSGVVAEVWRDGRRQVRLARLLGSPTCEIVPLDDHGARAAGQLCGTSATADVVDSSVVVLARKRGLRVLTSDADDLRRLDPRLEIVSV